MRGFGSSSRASARIWSLPRPWQLALNTKPRYIIEVIAPRFDKMSAEDQDKTLIHELLHIPRTFSGALIGHRHGSHRIDQKTVETFYQKYRQKNA